MSVLMIVSLSTPGTLQVGSQVWIGIATGQVAFITGADDLPVQRWRVLRYRPDRKININWKWEYRNDITGWSFSVPLWPWPILLLSATLLRMKIQKARGSGRGRCPSCGYSLVGLKEKSSICPECGAISNGADEPVG